MSKNNRVYFRAISDQSLEKGKFYHTDGEGRLVQELVKAGLAELAFPASYWPDGTVKTFEGEGGGVGNGAPFPKGR